MIIVGIDPGSQCTGFGAVRVEAGRVAHERHDAFVAPAAWSFSRRLAFMHERIAEALAQTRPAAVAVERIFLGRNADSAFKLGHVRGVCLLAAQSARAELVEYAARSVKKGIVGNGAASKEQVQMILFAALGVRVAARADASDALALAFHHARQLEVLANLRRGAGLARGL